MKIYHMENCNIHFVCCLVVSIVLIFIYYYY